MPEARTFTAPGQPFVGLALRDPEAYLDRLGPAQRALAEGNASLGFGKLPLNLSGLEDADPAEVARIVAERGRIQVASARRANRDWYVPVFGSPPG